LDERRRGGEEALASIEKKKARGPQIFFNIKKIVLGFKKGYESRHFIFQSPFKGAFNWRLEGGVHRREVFYFSITFQKNFLEEAFNWRGAFYL